MKKLLNIRTIIGILCIVSALALAYQSKTKNVDNDLSVLNIEKPTAAVLQVVAPIAKIVTDPTDRAKLAIFNQEFAKRVPSYDADVQQINDLYVYAAADFFKDTINDKYSGLDTKLVSLMQSVTTDENHKLTSDEKLKMSDNFLGLAWSLIQK